MGCSCWKAFKRAKQAAGGVGLVLVWVWVLAFVLFRHGRVPTRARVQVKGESFKRTTLKI